MTIRDATVSDLAAVTDIYNEVLLHSTAIYREEPTTTEERIAWWRAQLEKGYPLLVAEDEGSIIGFASFGDFRPWPGYRFTVEGTIHLRREARHRGIGTMLFQKLLSRARDAGKHMMIAGVDSENIASLRFMEKLGAERRAHLKEVGFKFGRFLDLVYFQIPLPPVT
jgi:L-amino acid N-acyltransferase YncA